MRNDQIQKKVAEIMAYKYESVLKSFEYSIANYKIVSEFLLSGDKTNPNVMLKVTEISKHFNKRPNDWFANPTVIDFIRTLILVKLENKDKKLIKAFKKWAKEEKAITRKSGNGQHSDFIDVINKLEHKAIVDFAKSIELIIVKRGNAELTGASSGTWINRDLAVEYARWLDPEFSIWISQKILELVNDGVAWNEIRNTTKKDYLPLTSAIKKYVIPANIKTKADIIYGQIANFINLRVTQQKAKDIREERHIKESELTRDYFEKLELDRIAKIQIFAEMIIAQLNITDLTKLSDMIANYKYQD